MGRSLFGVKWSRSLLSFANEDLLRHKYNIDHQPKSNLENGLHFVEELRFLPLSLSSHYYNLTDDGFCLFVFLTIGHKRLKCKILRVIKKK